MKTAAAAALAPRLMGGAMLSLALLAGATVAMQASATLQLAPLARADETRDAQAPPAGPPARGLCELCGLVESVVPVAAADGEAAGYDFTVRLRDGTSRVSRGTGATGWRAGDRIMLMGGAG